MILPALLDLAASSKEPELVSSALQAIRQLADDNQFAALLKVLESNDDNAVRNAAELNLETIIRKSKKPADLAKKLSSARDSTLKPDVQKALRRLSGVCETAKP